MVTARNGKNNQTQKNTTPSLDQLKVYSKWKHSFFQHVVEILGALAIFVFYEDGNLFE